MELRHLRYFLAVAEELNFTRAAARLGIGQSPLSQQIRDLEAEVGTALFHRVPHGAELTVAGAVFRQGAQAAVAQADRAKADAHRAGQGLTGRLRLGLTSSATFNPLVPDQIRTFRRRYPDVQLSIEEANSVHLIDRLRSDQLDVAFVRPSPAFPQDVVLHPIGDEMLVVALWAAHDLARSPEVDLAALASQPFVLFAKPVGSEFLRTVVSACRSRGFDPIPGQEAAQIGTIVNLVAAEIGVALVPASIAQIQVHGIAYRPVAGTKPTIGLALAARHGPTPALVRNFLALTPTP